MKRLLAGLLLVLACRDDGGTFLVIQVRTDMSPRVEFAFAEVQVMSLDGASLATRRRDAVDSVDWGLGVRLAELRGIPPGDYRAVVRLAGGDDGAVVQRPVRFEVPRGRVRAVELLLTRDCRNVECPGATGSARETACLGGRCVPEDCTEDNPEDCPDPSCENVRDCEDVMVSECAELECTDSGVCLAVPLHERCASLICDPELGCIGLTPMDLGVDGGDGGGSELGVDLGDMPTCPAGWGETLAFADDPPDSVLGEAFEVTWTPEPDAETTVVELLEVETSLLADRQEDPALPATLVAPEVGRYEVVVRASRAGCEDAEIRSRVIAACTEFWVTRAGALPQPVSDTGALAVGSTVLALGSSQLMTASVETGGALGAFTELTVDLSASETAFTSAGTRLASGAYGAPSPVDRVWVVGGAGSEGPWIRAFDLAGPGSVASPPVLFLDELNLVEATRSAAALVARGRLFVLGGLAPEPVPQIPRVGFDGASGGLLPPVQLEASGLPAAVTDAGGASLGETLYLLGGFDGATLLDTVRQGRVEADGASSWAEVAALPAARADVAAALDASGRWLFAVAGRDDAGEATPTVWRASIDLAGELGAWEALPPLPEAVDEHAAVFVARRLHVLGGRSGAATRTLRSLDLGGPGDTPLCP
ncbi:MAG: hypothetical protein AAGH15_08070 [Myxococcota bacterium]